MADNKINTSVTLSETVLDALALDGPRRNVSASIERIARAHFNRVGWPEVTRTKAKTNAKA